MRDIFAVDIGATNLRLALVDGAKVRLLQKMPTPRKSNPDIFLSELAKIINDYIKENGIPGKLPFGIAVAGPVVNKREKTVFFTEILGEFVSFSKLEKSLGQEISVINDADSAVLAEAAYGVGGDSLCYLTISSGIGGGVIKNGKLLPGKKTEVGHFDIDYPINRQCSCAGLNHWEAYTSGKHMINFMTEWGKTKNINTEGYNSIYEIFNQVRKGDKIANDFIDEVNKINAQGIEILEEKFLPEKIVLGGGLASNCRDIILPGVRKYLDKEIFDKITITELGDEISLLGVGAFLKTVNN